MRNRYIPYESTIKHGLVTLLRQSWIDVRGQTTQRFDGQKKNWNDYFKHTFFSQIPTPTNLKTYTQITMKFLIAALLAASASAFSPFGAKKAAVAAPAAPAFSVDTIPGALEPMGLFDPLGFAAKADEATLKRYREAELTHGRVAMLATVGFLVGEKVEGSSFLFDASISGPAITHLSQVPIGFFGFLAAGIYFAEIQRAKTGWVDPKDVPFDKPGLLNADYIPGNLGFDPLGLKPEDSEEFFIMQTKELQNGRLAMLAAAGFLAQELVDGKGIIEHLQA